MTESVEYRPFAAQLSNVYLTILALFCFKLFVKITLNLLTHFYIIRGNRKEAERISAEFYDCGQGQRSWADRSPLHDAASQGRLLSLKTLISQGHSVNVLTIDHVSPLHEACIGNHVACARALIDSGANVNVTTIDGATPLFNSCLVGGLGCVEALLESGARPGANVPCRFSPIHEASSRGHSKCVEALVMWGADVDFDIPHVGTPLYASCVSQQWTCARKLLDKGANVQKGTSFSTPLHAAAERDCTEIVKLLLEFGADVNARDLEFRRPVEVAPPSSLSEGFLLVYEATPRLLSHLCRKRIRDCLGRPRLHLLGHLPLPEAVKDFLHFR
ncbi:ankyrin repeat and SOCS box protein 5 isoform X2 [Denticeps clupeoides]|uniref:SOCS box domain-containing protein n=1 Tax=Denticeps clupeoides TaxID=299321 RepID=A0AAY4AAZ9_9TELE|nr:ankyrin repeat and SOCS box protein 5-like isoform X2 [Denticeps clupeoides]